MRQAMSGEAFARVQENLRKGREGYAAMMNRAVCGECGAAVLRRDERSEWVHCGPCNTPTGEGGKEE